MSEVSKKRILVFDFIRLFAILMVVLSHTLRVGNVPFDISYLGILGNVLFFFISGYLIYLNNNSIASKKDIVHFYKKRLLRIYPLYIFAFVVFVIISIFIGDVMCFGDIHEYSAFAIISNVFGLQMVFYPAYLAQMSLWFIGMILIFYLLYPIVVYFSHKNIIRYIIYSCIAIGILVGVRVFTGLIGGGVFEYYFVFVAGVCCAWINIFKSKYIKQISIIAFIIFGICLIITQIYHPAIKNADHLSLSLSLIFSVGCVFLLRIVYGISAVFVLYTIFSWIKPNKTFESLIVKGAFAAYAVYLFHGQFFTIVNKLLLSNEAIIADIFSNPLLYDLLLVVVLIPIIFVISYFLQKGENICVNKLKSRAKQ